MRRRSLLATPALLALAAPARGQAPLQLYTAGPGSAFLPYGEGIAAYLGRHGIPVAVRQSTGSLQNLSFVEDDPAALGTAFLGSAWDALQGTPAAGGRRHTRVRALFPMYETSFQVAALRASGITEFAHLAGKRVGCGPARGPAEVFFRAAAETAGITAEVLSGDPAAQAEALAEGRIDAFWQGAVVPIPSLLLALRRADALVFGLPAPLVAAVTGRLPYLSPTTLPPGTYPGQAAPIESFGAWNFVVANAALPEEQAYALTRQVLAARDPAAEIHPGAAATLARNAAGNRILPFHPGAARVYREAGIALAI
jgi:TRAP transporter TAXI family solute receptor